LKTPADKPAIPAPAKDASCAVTEQELIGITPSTEAYALLFAGEGDPAEFVMMTPQRF
jgi:hypothetical protein